MSNRYKQNRNGGQPQRVTTFNGTAIVIAVVTAILALAIVIIGVGSSWFTNPAVKTWFGATEQEQPKPDEGKNPEADKGTGGMDIADGSVTESGIKLNRRVISRASYEEEGISPLAESAYTLTVSVQPAGATDSFVWTITGNDDEGVTLTPMGKSAKVVCNKAFSTQKVIKVTSKSNSAITASCTVDYYKRLQGVTLNAPATLKLNTTSTDYTVSLSPTYGVGTKLDTTVTISSISVKLINQMYNNIHVIYNGMEADGKKTVTGNASTGKFSLVMSPTVESSFFNKIKGADIPAFYAEYFNDFLSSCKAYSANNQYEISVAWSAARAGGTIDSGTVKKEGKFDVSALKVDATNASLSDSSILF